MADWGGNYDAVLCLIVMRLDKIPEGEIRKAGKGIAWS